MLTLPATWSPEIDEVAEWILDARKLVKKLQVSIEVSRRESHLLYESSNYVEEMHGGDKAAQKEVRKEYGEQRKAEAARRADLKQDLRKAEKWLLISTALLGNPVARVVNDDRVIDDGKEKQP